VPADASPSLAEIDAEARLGYVRAKLVRARKHATGWMVVFGTFNLSVIVGQLAAIPKATEDELPDRYVGATAASIGLLSVVAVPPAPLLAERKLARLEAGWRGDRCGLLAEAERLFFGAARRQRFGTSWLMHVGSFLFNAGVGLVLGFGFDRWDTGKISASVGVLVGEIMFLSQPNYLVEDAERYRRGAVTTAAVPRASIGPYLPPGAAGGGISVTW
jgi:hypothetical protein